MIRGGSLPSVMGHNFSNIPAPRLQRSVFRRTHTHKTTFDAGWLIPFLVDEILPGDTMSVSANMFARLATPIYPIMDNLFLDTFYFFVPCRLLWDNWERFQGAQSTPGASIDYEIPIISDDEGGATSFAAHSLGDYFGLPVLPVEIPGADRPNSLPFRAYNLIWNEWFRDQNLQAPAVVDLDDGPDDVDEYVLRRRGKRHDYFTSCLPWPQRGDSVAIPIGTSAPVIGNNEAIGLMGRGTSGPTGSPTFGGMYSSGSGFTTLHSVQGYNQTLGASLSPVAQIPSGLIGLTTDPAASGMIADLSSATAATVNQLREAFAIQQILEADARGGTRYVEHLKAHWGVTSPDFRLQRPEYLGGSSERIAINGVPQTSSSDAESPQGNLAAYGQVSSRSGYHKSFVEHGYIIGLVNVRADITYQQGMRRLWSRRTRFDFYMPELAHLGEQAVLNKEIWVTSSLSDPDGLINAGVFGYQERWAEYRYFPSLITGAFRSDLTPNLDEWHLSTDFAALPVLNNAFIQDDPPVDRVVAVPTEPHILFDSFIEIKHARPMPVYSIPGLNRL